MWRHALGHCILSADFPKVRSLNLQGHTPKRRFLETKESSSQRCLFLAHFLVAEE